MIHLSRHETQLERRERLCREARYQRLLTFLLSCVLAAGIWLLLREVERAGGWMAIF